MTGPASRKRRSALAAEGPQQLDDLLRVPPRFARPGAVAEAVQFLADRHVLFVRRDHETGMGEPRRLLLKLDVDESNIDRLEKTPCEEIFAESERRRDRRRTMHPK